ncbi:hypothetical protein LTR53_015314, partial [Teratosphaeriaceae sp. CCFEE 6253]
MATIANPPSRAIPTNGAGDPFVGPGAGALRYAPFDNDQISSYTTNSPSQAKRALEAHLKDTDRRIQDASRLGSTLVQQRKELASRLDEVGQVQADNDVPAPLRKKLVELEREYNEIGKESARAFLPKSTAAGSMTGATPTTFTAQARESPTKVSAPSRRQRNQPSNRVHDIEFATEISTSLLAQVRQLQAALAERDDALRDISSLKAQLESDAAGMVQRIKHMDESEQRFKDENWNLEMRLQDLEGELRDTTDRHDRVHQSLKGVEGEKTAAHRELDELRLAHENLAEEHAGVKRQQEGDLHTLRRDVTVHQTEKQSLQRRVEELTAQNVELAKAVSSRWNQHDQTAATDFGAAISDRDDGYLTPEEVDSGSPVKGTPRHGMLESETLKSSLNHAHRMIQNLKNNIHREKTEKIELKRLLQDAREELDTRRSEPGGGAAANMAKKRRSEPEAGKFRRPARPDRLGASRGSTTTVETLKDEAEWEEHDGTEGTPSKSRSLRSGAAGAGAESSDRVDHGAFGGETTDAGFETARERDSTTEAFETGNEGLAGDGDSDVTETEGGGLGRSDSVRAAQAGSPLLTSRAAKRRSVQSTASTSGDEDEDVVRTPVQSSQPKYRLRLNRGSRRSGRVSDIREASPSLHSPASSTGTPQPAGQTLGDELDALDDGSSVGGTPSRLSLVGSPEIERQLDGELATPAKSVAGEDGVEGEPEEADEHEPEISSPTLSPEHAKPEGEQAQQAYQANVAMLAHEPAVKRERMVDVGVMTEPWEPKVPEREAVAAPHAAEESAPKPNLIERAGEIVGGTLAGFGLGRIGRHKEAAHGEEGSAQEEKMPAPEVHEQAEPGAGDETSGILDRETPIKRVRPAASSSDLPMALTGLQTSTAHAEEGLAPQPVMDEDPAAIFDKEPKSLTNAVSEPLTAAKVHGSTAAIAHSVLPVAAFQQSATMSQETEPILAPAQPLAKDLHAGEVTKPEMPFAVAAPLAVQADAKRDLGFSTIDSQAFELVTLPNGIAAPLLPPSPMLPERTSKGTTMLYDDDDDDDDYDDYERTAEPRQVETDGIPGTEAARAGAGFFASMAAPALMRTRSRSMPASRSASQDRPLISKEDQMLIEPKVFGGMREDSSGIPTLVFGGDDSDQDTHVPPSSISRGLHPIERNHSAESIIPVTRPLSIKKPMMDEGSQTAVSGQEIDDMLRNKSRTSSMATSFTDAGFMPGVPGTPPAAGQRRSIDGMPIIDHGPRRPPSASSMRSKSSVRFPPPLPENYSQKIVAATQKGPATPGPSTAGTMGPPMMPASAYKQVRVAPKTPGDRVVHHERSMSRDGTTPRPVRHRDSRNTVQSQAGISRRTSMSSFASELDERFNITRADIMYPGDVAPSTDPRMIQAITQTMIGEYLWKYTRKAGRSETSTTRHRRFFWIHPYTRTLYWSEQDPSTAGKNMLKAKSMAIQSVRVITDDNTYPPGLHRKSIVVVTPGRDVVFTAPTGQRHETWFNALSYLLLRTEQEKQEAADTVNEEDLAEFNPSFSIRRSISRLTGRNASPSRTSLSSYNSRTTRTSSPQRRETNGGSLAQRQSQAALRKGAGTPTPNPMTTAPTLVPTDPAASRTSTMRSRASVSGRFSSLASRFRAPGSQRGTSVSTRARSSMSMRSRPGDPSDIYDASVVNESAEDLRAVIERQEKDADRLENVRACCD